MNHQYLQDAIPISSSDGARLAVAVASFPTRRDNKMMESSSSNVLPQHDEPHDLYNFDGDMQAGTNHRGNGQNENLFNNFPTCGAMSNLEAINKQHHQHTQEDDTSRSTTSLSFSWSLGLPSSPSSCGASEAQNDDDDEMSQGYAPSLSSLDMDEGALSQDPLAPPLIFNESACSSAAPMRPLEEYLEQQLSRAAVELGEDKECHLLERVACGPRNRAPASKRKRELVIATTTAAFPTTQDSSLFSFLPEEQNNELHPFCDQGLTSDDNDDNEPFLLLSDSQFLTLVAKTERSCSTTAFPCSFRDQKYLDRYLHNLQSQKESVKIHATRLDKALLQVQNRKKRESTTGCVSCCIS